MRYAGHIARMEIRKV